jgi:hypothetical protein
MGILKISFNFDQHYLNPNNFFLFFPKKENDILIILTRFNAKFKRMVKIENNNNNKIER